MNAARTDRLRSAFVVLGVLGIFTFLGTCSDARAGDWAVEPLVTYQHTSDIARGCPFACAISEPTQDYLGFGATISTPNRRFEIDLTHGLKSFDFSFTHANSTESGSAICVRFYPRRK